MRLRPRRCQSCRRCGCRTTCTASRHMCWRGSRTQARPGGARKPSFETRSKADTESVSAAAQAVRTPKDRRLGRRVSFFNVSAQHSREDSADRVCDEERPEWFLGGSCTNRRSASAWSKRTATGRSPIPHVHVHVAPQFRRILLLSPVWRSSARPSLCFATPPENRVR